MVRLLPLFLAVLVAPSATASDVTTLTPDNYEEVTDGRTLFVKFFAPWVSFLFCLCRNLHACLHSYNPLSSSLIHNMSLCSVGTARKW